MPAFRLCSTCRSHSQAPLCQCTLQVISIHLEGTFGRLRYLLGGDRPSQTAHLAGSSIFVELGPELKKSGISRSTPQTLACLLQSLPPILHIYNPSPMPSYSKAPRGLFVLSRVTRIFTGLAISPSPSLRQRSGRYTIRAGRNLPDKGFRYLRTVIVTAAVHRGFSSELCPQADEPIPLTFRHWAGVSPYTSPFGLAETCVFDKQSPEPLWCHPQGPLAGKQPSPHGHPFSQSYGVKLSNSLTKVLSFTWGHLPLHTCVGLRYGR